jgi:hypothetical protein
MQESEYLQQLHQPFNIPSLTCRVYCSVNTADAAVSRLRSRSRQDDPFAQDAAVAAAACLDAEAHEYRVAEAFDGQADLAACFYWIGGKWQSFRSSYATSSESSTGFRRGRCAQEY